MEGTDPKLHRGKPPTWKGKSSAPVTRFVFVSGDTERLQTALENLGFGQNNPMHFKTTANPYERIQVEGIDHSIGKWMRPIGFLAEGKMVGDPITADGSMVAAAIHSELVGRIKTLISDNTQAGGAAGDGLALPCILIRDRPAWQLASDWNRRKTDGNSSGEKRTLGRDDGLDTHRIKLPKTEENHTVYQVLVETKHVITLDMIAGALENFSILPNKVGLQNLPPMFFYRTEQLEEYVNAAGKKWLSFDQSFLNIARAVYGCSVEGDVASLAHWTDRMLVLHPTWHARVNPLEVRKLVKESGIRLADELTEEEISDLVKASSFSKAGLPESLTSRMLSHHVACLRQLPCNPLPSYGKARGEFFRNMLLILHPAQKKARAQQTLNSLNKQIISKATFFGVHSFDSRKVNRSMASDEAILRANARDQEQSIQTLEELKTIFGSPNHPHYGMAKGLGHIPGRDTAKAQKAKSNRSNAQRKQQKAVETYEDDNFLARFNKASRGHKSRSAAPPAKAGSSKKAALAAKQEQDAILGKLVTQFRESCRNKLKHVSAIDSTVLESRVQDVVSTLEQVQAEVLEEQITLHSTRLGRKIMEGRVAEAESEIISLPSDGEESEADDEKHGHDGERQKRNSKRGRGDSQTSGSSHPVITPTKPSAKKPAAGVINLSDGLQRVYSALKVINHDCPYSSCERTDSFNASLSRSRPTRWTLVRAKMILIVPTVTQPFSVSTREKCIEPMTRTLVLVRCTPPRSVPSAGWTTECSAYRFHILTQCGSILQLNFLATWLIIDSLIIHILTNSARNLQVTTLLAALLSTHALVMALGTRACGA